MKKENSEKIDKETISKNVDRIRHNGEIVNAIVSIIIVPTACIVTNCIFNVPMFIYYVSFVIICMFISVVTCEYIITSRIRKYINHAFKLVSTNLNKKKRIKKVYGKKKPNKIS